MKAEQLQIPMQEPPQAEEPTGEPEAHSGQPANASGAAKRGAKARGKTAADGRRSRNPPSPPMSAAGDATGNKHSAKTGAGGFASLPRPVPRDCRDPLALARGGLLFDLLSLYLERCAGKPGTPETANIPAGKGNGAEKSKKAAPISRFPNLAGFCRFLGVGMARMEILSTEEPEIYDSLCAIFEDEALNSGVSASVLTPYFKKRLGYADKPSASPTGDEESGGIRLIFDHDVWEDGA